MSVVQPDRQAGLERFRIESEDREGERRRGREREREGEKFVAGITSGLAV